MLCVASEGPPVSEPGVGARAGYSRSPRGAPCRVTEPVSPLRRHGGASCRCRRTLGRPRPRAVLCPQGNTAAHPGAAPCPTLSPSRGATRGQSAARQRRPTAAARRGWRGRDGTGRGRGARGCTGEAAPRERLWPGPVAQGDGGRWIAVSRGAAPGSVSLPSRRGRVPPRRAHRAVLLVSRKHPNPLAARVPPPSLPAGGPFCPQAQTGSSRAHILLFPSLRAPSGTWRLLIAFQGAESQSAVWMEPQAVPEVGCSLHHPQPRGDLRTAAHTDQLLTVRRAGATGDPCPGGCSPQSHLLGLAKLDWGWLPHCGPALGCTVPAWLLEAGAEGSWNSPGELGSAERA